MACLGDGLSGRIAQPPRTWCTRSRIASCECETALLTAYHLHQMAQCSAAYISHQLCSAGCARHVNVPKRRSSSHACICKCERQSLVDPVDNTEAPTRPISGCHESIGACSVDGMRNTFQHTKLALTSTNIAAISMLSDVIMHVRCSSPLQWPAVHREL